MDTSILGSNERENDTPRSCRASAKTQVQPETTDNLFILMKIAKKAMRIPAEALPSFTYGIDARAKDTPAQRQRPEPVDRLANLRPKLSQSARDEQNTAEREEALRRAILAGNKRNVYLQGRGERRKSERRKAKIPVLLDTRATRSRRQDAAETTIDFEV